MFDEHEPAELELTPDLAAMELQLARLTPAAPHIDRDRLMFAAGREAVIAAQRLRQTEPSPNPSLQGRGIDAAATLRVAGPHRWFWPAATATMTAATLLLATMLVWQRAAQPVAAQSATPPLPTNVATAKPDHSGVTESITPAAVQSENFGWPMSSPPTAGYLGQRYIALTRGVGELETHNRTANSDFDTSGNTPATQRELLRELLPSADNKVSPHSAATGRNS
jgi:hypothetical protein